MYGIKKMQQKKVQESNKERQKTDKELLQKK